MMETIDAEPPHKPSGIRLDWNINLGHILQAAVVVIGLVSWAIASAGRAEQTQRDLSGLKADVGVQLRDLRESLNKDLDGIHQELRALSDQRIRMEAAEKGLAAQDGRNAAQDDRISALERQFIELRAELNSVTQASRVRLPGK
jgi:septal ring factor EnvC (AmiA/AmiB activator)